MAKDDIPDRIVPMRVIVCGVQRTGTLSVRHALYRLGLYDCYHMHDVRHNPSTDGALWIRALRAKYAGDGDPFTRDDWDGLLGRCQAVADIPAALFGPELAEAYPEAKVVILNRDPESWYESVRGSIHADRPLPFKIRMLFCLLLNPAVRAWARFGMCMGSLAMGFKHASERDKALAWYDRTYKGFRDEIPADRRIEYSVRDGWAPLCAYLDLPVPTVTDPETGVEVEAPFPHLNDRENFVLESERVQQEWVARGLENLFGLIGRAAVTGGLAYGGYLVWKTRLGGRL